MSRARASREPPTLSFIRLFAAIMVLSSALPSPARGQGLATLAERFQSSWAGEDVGSLQGLMGPAVGLDVEGEAHLGVPPRQAAATLDRLFDRYAPASLEMVRHREPEAAGSGGFAEFRWRPLTRDTAEPVPYVIFVSFRSVGSELRIAELRVLR